MARLPRAMVPITSGSGVSRYSYQKAYHMVPGNAIKLGRMSSPRARSTKTEASLVKGMANDKTPSGFDMFDSVWDAYRGSSE